MFKTQIKRTDGYLSLSQPIVWLSALAYNTEFYSKAAIGYVQHDCAISWLDEIKAIWQSYRGMAQYPDRWPELEFPLIKMPKKEIWNLLDEEIRNLCVYCESPIDKIDIGYVDCDECAACKRRRREEEDFA